MLLKKKKEKKKNPNWNALPGNLLTKKSKTPSLLIN